MPLLTTTRRNCKRGWLNCQEALLCLRYISHLIFEGLCDFADFVILNWKVMFVFCHFRSEELAKLR
jgi:hypothetical protein